jgi:hypothetical protein
MEAGDTAAEQAMTIKDAETGVDASVAMLSGPTVTPGGLAKVTVRAGDVDKDYLLTMQITTAQLDIFVGVYEISVRS